MTDLTEYAYAIPYSNPKVHSYSGMPGSVKYGEGKILVDFGD